MTTIPDEIQQKAANAFIQAIKDDDAAPGAGLRAAMQVAIEWALEESAKIADEQADEPESKFPSNTARIIASEIRARKDKP